MCISHITCSIKGIPLLGEFARVLQFRKVQHVSATKQFAYTLHLTLKSLHDTRIQTVGNILTVSLSADFKVFLAAFVLEFVFVFAAPAGFCKENGFATIDLVSISTSGIVLMAGFQNCDISLYPLQIADLQQIRIQIRISN